MEGVKPKRVYWDELCQAIAAHANDKTGPWRKEGGVSLYQYLDETVDVFGQVSVNVERDSPLYNFFRGCGE